MKIQEFERFFFEELKAIASINRMVCKKNSRCMFQKSEQSLWIANIQRKSFLVEGQIEIIITSVVKPLLFDDIQFSIISPDEKVRVSDSIRIDGAFAARPFVYDTRIYHFPCENIGPNGEFVHAAARCIVDDYLLSKQSFQIKVFNQSNSVIEFLAKLGSSAPLTAGMSYLCLEDYAFAEKYFQFADNVNEIWHITIGDKGRYLHRIFIDYCIAMQSGITWTKDILINGLPIKTEPYGDNF